MLASGTQPPLRSETTEDMLRNVVVRPASVELNGLDVRSPIHIAHWRKVRIVRASVVNILISHGVNGRDDSHAAIWRLTLSVYGSTSVFVGQLEIAAAGRHYYSKLRGCHGPIWRYAQRDRSAVMF